MCVGGVCFVCKTVCAVDGAGILVSIVVSIPACHAGDPGSIRGREAFALAFALAFAPAFARCFQHATLCS